MKNLQIELIILVFIIAMAFLIKALLKGKAERARNAPFAIIAVVILLMEVAKQVWSFSLPTGYNLYYIPLQICSLFLLCYPVAAFAKGSVRDWAWCMSLCLGCSASFGQIFLSQILTRDYIFKLFTPEAILFHYHTVLYHHLVVLHFLLMILLQPYKPKKEDILPTVILYMGFMIVSCIFANLLQTNFSGYINYGAAIFDYFKRYGQLAFNAVGFSLNTAEYLLGVFICFMVSKLVAARKNKER
jgi:hypothetical protein